MKKIKIEKNIPLPPKRNKYPFNKMEIGDSIFCAGKNTKLLRASVFSASAQWAKRNNKGVKFTSAKEGSGIRIWRIV